MPNAQPLGRWITALLYCLTAAVGCGDDRADVYEAPLEMEGPVVASGQFLYLHRTFSQLVAITPSFEAEGLSFVARRVTLGADPEGLEVSPDGTLAFAINAGDQTLSIVDLADFSEHRFELPSDYDAVTIGPNGRFVVAHFADAEAGGSGDLVFRNQNEITVFDLNPQADSGGVRLSQVDARVLSLRSSPLGFDFAPAFSIDGITHHLLVVRAASALALVDMTAADEINLQRRLFFVPEDSTARLIPIRVLFTEDDPADDFDMRMFVLTSGAQDIFDVSILPPGPADETQLALSINQFPAGQTPVEMIRYADTEGEQKLLVLNGQSKELVVVDIDTGNSTELDIDWEVNRALPFDLTDEDTGVTERWALLYRPGLPTVVFAHLDDLETRGTRALSPLRLSRSVGSVSMRPAPDARQAIVVHEGGTALSVLDLSRRFDIPLPGSATLRNTAFSGAGDRLFTTVAEVPVLAIIDLENGHPSQVDLPAPGGAIQVMADPQVILVDHGRPEGRITLMNGVEPELATSLSIDGLFLEGVADQADAQLGAR